MRLNLDLSVFALIAFQLMSVVVDAGEKTSLFDGKTLNGWTRIGGKKDVWKVENGLLIMNGESGGWLAADGEYADFEFEVEFQLTSDSNSGVYLRAPADSSHISRTGMEIQILDDFHAKYADIKPWQRTGSIYHVAAAKTGFLKKNGEWNRMKINADGPHIIIELNGQRIVDDMIDKHSELAKEHTGLARKSGKIGLQSHNGIVAFRNIYVKKK